MTDSYEIMLFRTRKIENNRDEEVCRRWDVLASEKVYFYYNNKWWLHLNKSGSDTLPLRKRSDFKQALSTSERLHQEAGEEQFAPTPYWKNVGIEFVLYIVEMTRLLVVCLKFRKSRRKRHAKACERTGRPVVDSTSAKTSEDGFQEFNLFCYR